MYIYIYIYIYTYVAGEACSPLQARRPPGARWY